MPYRRRRPAKKSTRRPKKSTRRPRRVGTSVSKQSAHICESYEVEDLLCNTSYQSTLDLSYFPRSQAIGTNFQEYKITKLEYQFEPLFNTFQEGLAVINTVPQLLWYVDRTGTTTAWSKAQFEKMGVLPKKYISNMKMTFKPNTLVVSANSAILPQPALTTDLSFNYSPAQSVQIQFNKWFSTQYDATLVTTNPSGAYPTAWYGCKFLIDQQQGEVALPVGRLTVKAWISFRGPSLPVGQSQSVVKIVPRLAPLAAAAVSLSPP